MDPYQELGVGKGADEATIRRAYRRRSAKVHPDRGGNHEEMQRVNAAYALLSSPERRARFDETGDTGEQINSEQAQFISAMAGYVLRAVNTVDVNRSDVMGLVRQFIEADIANVEAMVKDRQKAANKHERALKRVTHKGGGENMVAMILSAEIAKMKTNVEQNKHAAEMLKRLYAMAREYDYQVDEPTPHQGGVYVTFTSTP